MFKLDKLRNFWKNLVNQVKKNRQKILLLYAKFLKGVILCFTKNLKGKHFAKISLLNFKRTILKEV